MRTCLLLSAILSTPLVAQVTIEVPVAPPTPGCGASCVEWNEPHAPFRVFGNTWYVGTNGLSALLVTTSAGLVLLDGALQESAHLIARSIATIGFRVRDIRHMMNSHVHHDHAGGMAALQAASGATVHALAPSAVVLRRGTVGDDDPQHGISPPITPLVRVRVVPDRGTVRVGDVTFTAHHTGGHTPGSTTWTWESCDAGTCRTIVYADSQTPVSADGFKYTTTRTYRRGLSEFAAGATRLESLRCDILITPHPGASDLWPRLAARDAGNADGLVDSTACRRYAAAARTRVAERVKSEQAH
jgi:metallo-beta-lactamase class B